MFVLFLAADTFQFVLGRIHVLVRHQHDTDIVTLLDFGDHVALFIEQVGGNLHRKLGHYAPGAFLERLFLDNAQDGKGQRVNAANEAMAVTTGAHLVGRIPE